MDAESSLGIASTAPRPLVLLLDDDDAVRAATRNLLEGWGYDGQAFCTWQEVVSAVADWSSAPH